MAGVGKSDITRWDRLYAKALVLDDGTTRAAIISMDVIAMGGTFEIKDDFLPTLRGKIVKELGISDTNIQIYASHNPAQRGSRANS